ncbi:Trans-1,2-dihydrobenzene-1,2-diol dehydrogenase [Orchesella cincta]|uniref:Trans-1,2-dihydrobenzene-1,2-diol dehydrogenase n=1 Tax=Orchesella cincta TaxID=48709 RepID=A0A1D2MWV0_ORCCI|nr:Trans-1,2-dihydrobenzene-1,2-diol dehydrogenase [Orchesella cincta]
MVDFVASLTAYSEDEHQVVACAARSLDSAKQFAEKYGIPKAYDSYEELVKDPNVQVAYIGSINNQHLPLGKLAMDHGKHVLVEKPMGINVRETKELIEYGRSKKLFLMEGIWSRFFPAYQRIKEELAKGTIGDIVQLTSNFGTMLTHKERCKLKELGGGSILDIGIYNIQFISLVMGGQKPEKIVAAGVLNENGVDDGTSTTLIYPNGVTATVISSGRCKMECEAYAYGTKGYLKLPKTFWCPTSLITPNGTEDFDLPKLNKPVYYGNSEGLAYEAEEVRRCITKGLLESPLLPLNESLLIAEIMESIRKQIGYLLLLNTVTNDGETPESRDMLRVHVVGNILTYIQSAHVYPAEKPQFDSDFMLGLETTKEGNDLKWGILSCGKISNDFVSSLTSYSEDEHKVVACAARSLDSAKQFAEKNGIPKAYGSYEELVKDPDVQVTYIGSVNNQHLSLAKLAIENGKHVLVEKPMGINVRETKELIEFARSKKVFLMEAIWSRCFPAYQRLREELAKGSIGDVVQLTCNFGTVLTHKDRCQLKELGGGTILDIGVYNIQFVSLVMGGQKPEKIIATGTMNEHGVDDSSSTTLIYPNGVTATIVTNGRCKMECDACVYGTKGFLKLPKTFWCPTTLITSDVSEDFELPKLKNRTVNGRNGEGLAYEAEEVRRCLTKGLLESPLMTLDESLLIAEIMESIRKQIGVVYPQDSQ